MKVHSPSPSLFGTRDSFTEDSFSMDWRGTWFRDDSSPLHYCALYFYHDYIRSASDHQTLDAGGWRPLTQPLLTIIIYVLTNLTGFFWTSLKGRDFLCPLQGSRFFTLWQRHSTGLFSGYKCWVFPMFCNTHTYHLVPHGSHSLFGFCFLPQFS